MTDRLNTLLRRLRLLVLQDREAIRRAAITFAAGLVVLLVMQIPVAERSFLGAVDREMLDTAFKMRADVIAGDADPVLFLDIDDRSLVGDPQDVLAVPAPSATTSRGLVAELLEFVRTAPPESAPQVVLVDVDVATPTPGEPDGVARLREVLAAWSRTPTAPPLVIARQVFPPASLGVSGAVGVLPVSPYDDVVGPAPNIFWGSVKMLADKDAVIREFLPFECMRTAQGPQVLYSSVLLAYGFLQEGRLPPGSRAERWIAQAEPWCREEPARYLSHGERINYHLSLSKTFEDRVWPELPASWDGHARCGPGDATVFRRLSAIDVVQAGPDASRGLLCRRLVVIGGTNTPAADFQPSPIDEMAGPMILVNSIRGLQMSDGGLNQIPFALQVLVLLMVTLAISLTFTASRKARERFARMKAARRGIDPTEGIQLIVLNPVVLNWAVAFAAHFVGVGLLLISLDFALWGFLSAPAIGAAVTETIQEFADD